MCLNCPLPECVNCLGGGAVVREDRRVHQLSEVRRLSALGYSDKAMSAVIGVNPHKISEFRKELGIPSLRLRMARGEA